VTGHAAEHTRLEEELAAFTGRERALLFSTGYMANLAVMTTLASRGETVLLDRLSHASLIDGGLLSGARFKRFAHADARAAESAITESTSVLATDGVFSMDGDVGPLADLAGVAKSQDAWFVVDDAHGLGVIGATGRGAVEHFALDADAVPVLVGTLGKAFGSFGAFVAGSAELIELLMQKARPYIYTTALPQPVAAASRKALEIAQRETWRRERVLALAARFRQGAEQAGVPLLETSAAADGGHQDSVAVAATQAQPLTPIQPVFLGSSEAALLAQRDLLVAGFCVVAIRPPTVPQGSARLRVALSAAHTEAQVDGLVETLSRVCAARNVVS
jgi:8-amino-7-oxononanoate synthase